MKSVVLAVSLGAAMIGCALVSDSDQQERLASLDQDEDGFVASDDCDDNNAAAFPGNVEDCDNIDNDCDGEIDEDSFLYLDADMDGYGDPETGESVGCEEAGGFVLNSEDCNDEDPLAWSGAVEICNDGSDNDCDGSLNQCQFPSALTSSELDIRLDAGELDEDFGYRVAWVSGFGSEDHTSVLVSSPSGAISGNASDFAQGAVSFFPGSALSAQEEAVQSPSARFVDSHQQVSQLDGYLGFGLSAGAGPDGETPFFMVTQPAGEEVPQSSNAQCRVHWLEDEFLGDSLLTAGEREIREASSKSLTADPCSWYADYGIAFAQFEFIDSSASEQWTALGIQGFSSTSGKSRTGAVQLIHWPDVSKLHEGIGDPELLLVEDAPESDADFGSALAAVAGEDGDILAMGRRGGVYWRDQGDLALIFEDRVKGSSVTVELSQSQSFLHSEGSDSSFGTVLQAVDIDGDGADELAVGAPGESASDPGEVFVMDRLSAAFSAESAFVSMRGGKAGDRFGAALASGDLNRDGYEDVMVGAPGYNFERGTVIIYQGSAAGELQILAEIYGDAGEFGSALDAGGDLTKDGADDLLIGAPGANTEESNGAVFILQGLGF